MIIKQFYLNWLITLIWFYWHHHDEIMDPQNPYTYSDLWLWYHHTGLIHTLCALTKNFRWSGWMSFGLWPLGLGGDNVVQALKTCRSIWLCHQEWLFKTGRLNNCENAGGTDNWRSIPVRWAEKGKAIVPERICRFLSKPLARYLELGYCSIILRALAAAENYGRHVMVGCSKCGWMSKIIWLHLQLGWRKIVYDVRLKGCHVRANGLHLCSA